MKDSAYNFNKRIFLSIGLVSIIFFIPMFLGLNAFIKASSDEVINSWFENEKINIQQGNLLSSVTKLQRSISKSVLVKAVVVCDTQGRELVKFGSEKLTINTDILNLQATEQTVKTYKINFYKNLYYFSNANLKVYIITGSTLSLYLLIGILIYTAFFFTFFGIVIRKETIFEEKIKNEVEINRIALNLKLSENISLIASQVSHDIRSPLASLNIIIEQLENIPENYRKIIQSSIQRINDIANNLLNINKKDQSANDLVQIELIAPIIESILSEKRIQYRDRTDLDITFHQNCSCSLFAQINTTELKRVLSNLINNSVESIEGPGRIDFSLKQNKEIIVLSVSDNGKGIPSHILSQLGTKRLSYGKTNSESGSGLGLYHAKTTIESFNGKMEILSTEGVGTTIIITLPKAKSSSWFVERLSLAKNEKIIILDDDQSIHHAWIEKFKNHVEKSQVTLHHFYNGNDFSSFVQKQTDNNYLCLVDYELSGQKSSGLDLIEDNKIAARSILVTSRYEEKEIRDRVINLNLHLIPKGMINLIPVESITPIEEENKIYDYVLIDDDALVRITWQTIAKKKNIRFLALEGTTDFENYKSSIDKNNSYIYIDSELGKNSIKGENFAKTLHDEGYQKLFIASGHEAEKFAHLSWLGFSRKECPFKD